MCRSHVTCTVRDRIFLPPQLPPVFHIILILKSHLSAHPDDDIVI